MRPANAAPPGLSAEEDANRSLARLQFAQIPARAPGGRVHVVIDTPMGSRNKYKLDRQTGLFKLGRILPSGAAFPHDFGFIPHTRADDGDALDVMVLGEAPVALGVVLEVLLIGTLKGRQTEKHRTISNDRLLGVAVTAVNPPLWRTVHDLPRGKLDELRHFFVSYNAAQGRTYRPTGIGGPAAAERTVRQGERRYAAAET